MSQRTRGETFHSLENTVDVNPSELLLRSAKKYDLSFGFLQSALSQRADGVCRLLQRGESLKFLTVYEIKYKLYHQKLYSIYYRVSMLEINKSN